MCLGTRLGKKASRKVERTGQGEHYQVENQGDGEQQEKRAFPTVWGSKLLQKIGILSMHKHTDFLLCSSASVLRRKTGKGDDKEEENEGKTHPAL